VEGHGESVCAARCTSKPRCRRTAWSRVDALARKARGGRGWHPGNAHESGSWKRPPTRAPSIRRILPPLRTPNLNPKLPHHAKQVGSRRRRGRGSRRSLRWLLSASDRVDITPEVWDKLSTVASPHCPRSPPPRRCTRCRHGLFRAPAGASAWCRSVSERNIETMLMMTTGMATRSRSSPRRRRPGRLAPVPPLLRAHVPRCAVLLAGDKSLCLALIPSVWKMTQEKMEGLFAKATTPRVMFKMNLY
jgi:hypothetical protein